VLKMSETRRGFRWFGQVSGPGAIAHPSPASEMCRSHATESIRNVPAVAHASLVRGCARNIVQSGNERTSRLRTQAQQRRSI
jgi:hypothetical protein